MTGKNLSSAGIAPTPGACPADAVLEPASAAAVEREMVRRLASDLRRNGYAISRDVPRVGWHTRRAFLLILAVGPSARAAGNSIQASYSSPALAFERYLASHRHSDPFKRSAPVGVIVEASLPGFCKSAGLLAVRTQDENKPAEIRILQSMGDATVSEEIIDRCFALHEGLAVLPPSSATITPADYDFRFAGQVKTEGPSAYIYDVRPRSNRRNLIVGQLWMDCRTGQEIMLAGHFRNEPTMGGRIQFVRDTKLAEGSARARVTHTSFAIPRLGRAELVITELILDHEILPPAE
jgi:hypothetical protein